MKKQINNKLILNSTIMLIFLIIFSFFVLSVPPFPHSFTGTAKAGSTDIAVSASISARVGGTYRTGSTIVITEAGYYGNISSLPPMYLPVQGSNDEDLTGDTITFFLGCAESSNTSTWTGGQVTTLDLTIASGATYCGDGTCNGLETRGSADSCTESENVCRTDCGVPVTAAAAASTGGGGSTTSSGAAGAVVTVSDAEDLDEFGDQFYEGIILTQKKGESVSMTLDGTDYLIKIDQVADDYVVLKVGDKVITIQVGSSSEVDLNDDGHADLKINLLSIKYGKAELKYTKLAEKKIEPPEQPPEPEEPVCGNDICEQGETVDNCPEDCKEVIITWVGWLIAGIIIIVGLIIYFFVVKKKPEEEE